VDRMLKFLSNQTERDQYTAGIVIKNREEADISKFIVI
jgi:hypothetical protein